MEAAQVNVMCEMICQEANEWTQSPISTFNCATLIPRPAGWRRTERNPRFRLGKPVFAERKHLSENCRGVCLISQGFHAISDTSKILYSHAVRTETENGGLKYEAQY